eukprot:scaffold3556_cov190-Cylindrotheca_fusiformis.AAC.14
MFCVTGIATSRRNPTSKIKGIRERHLWHTPVGEEPDARTGRPTTTPIPATKVTTAEFRSTGFDALYPSCR